jgi:hypothetical protein
MHEKETKKKQILAKLESHISKPKRNLSWFGKDPKQPCSASPQRGANRPAITAQCTAYKPVEQHSQTAKGTRGLLKQVTCRCKLKPKAEQLAKKITAHSHDGKTTPQKPKQFQNMMSKTHGNFSAPVSHVLILLLVLLAEHRDKTA